MFSNTALLVFPILKLVVNGLGGVAGRKGQFNRQTLSFDAMAGRIQTRSLSLRCVGAFDYMSRFALFPPKKYLPL
jgi:hypothetical protein